MLRHVTRLALALLLIVGGYLIWAVTAVPPH
jgi:hypothetical protein